MHPVQYASRSIPKEEKWYSTFEQEALAVVFSLKKFPKYLLSGPFVIYRDHQALTASFQKTYIHGMLSRWLNLMAEHEFKIKHISAEKNVIADYLLRGNKETGSDTDYADLKIDGFLL